MDTIKAVDDFPGYFVSEFGEVLRETDDGDLRPVRQNVNFQHVRNVSLYFEGRQQRRSVAVLVAEGFVPSPSPRFNTVIHKDGNRANCNAENLLWRPRSYAIQYHRQFISGYDYTNTKPIFCITTGETFDTIHDAGVRFGLLWSRIHFDTVNGSQPVWPDGHRFTFDR